MQIKPFPVILKETRILTPNVKHFVLDTLLPEPLSYMPGQFITIHFEHQQKVFRRSYSIANAPTQSNLIEFAAGFVEGGIASDYLFKLQAGDTIHITGAFGRLTLKDETPKRYILMATSTGITPYRSMLPELKQRLAQHPDLQVVILQGVQQREDVLYKEDFIELCHHCPRVKLRIHLSRASNDLQTYEHAGYVQTALPELSVNPCEDIVYLCGNPGMIDDTFAYLKDLGFGMQQIIREKYISGK